MNVVVVFFVLFVGLARTQLNFNGNPLTENTEYTAEETHVSQRPSKQRIQKNDGNYRSDQSQVSYPIFRNNDQTRLIGDKNSELPRDQTSRSPILVDERSTIGPDPGSITGNVESAQESRRNPYDQEQKARMAKATSNGTSISPAAIALNTFLNSKTPEESRISLDYYLQSRQPQTVKQSRLSDAASLPMQSQEQPQLLPQNGQQQQFVHPVQQVIDPRVHSHSRVDQTKQQSLPVPQQIDQQQQLFLGPAYPGQQQQPLQSGTHTYTHFNHPSIATQELPVLAQPGAHQQPQRIFQQNPLVAIPSTDLQARKDSILPANLQTRNDLIPSPFMQQRFRQVRGKPYPFAQPKIGSGYYRSPVPAPFRRRPPIETIYTKPPGFQHGQMHVGSSPGVYEDASAWFPDSDYPPPANDVYYSQLYAQSYDPHYYNYIAKTGKIKPHLYGKLGKLHQDDGNGGIWSELLHGFAQHGLKNIMTPTFLLGMTLPMITVMLMALVQKRSFARSGARNFPQEDALQEYTERLQRAIECYEKRRARTKENATADDC